MAGRRAGAATWPAWRSLPRKGALFICDEVITGFRIGLRGAQGRLGVTADLAIYAKAVAAGFPLALVAGRRDVMDTLLDKGVMHGGTYNGTSGMAPPSPPSTNWNATTARSIATSSGVAARLMQGLAALADKHRLPMRVQGLPAIFQVFFTTPGTAQLPRGGCLRPRRSARLSPCAAGGGHPHQPGRQVVPVDGA